MPYSQLLVKEGFYTEDTRSDSAGRWINGDHVRFVTDFPEKIGGWTKLSDTQFDGVCRALITWTSNENWKYTALGTNTKLYIFFDGEFIDITPYQTGSFQSNIFSTNITSNIVLVTIPDHGLNTNDYVFFSNVTPFAGLTINGIYQVNTVVDANNYTILAGSGASSTVNLQGGLLINYYTILDLTNPFTTLIGSSIITVSQTNHGVITGDFITFTNASSVGGITPNGTYNVLSVIDANTYTFDSGVIASSSATGGGIVNYAYQINVGPADTNIGDGWGVLTYGAFDYGTPRPDAGVIFDFPRIWSFDTWGDDLVASPRDSSIYYWVHQNIPITNIATIIPNAPIQTKTIAVWPEARILIAFGCTTIEGEYDPMCIRWSSVNDYTQWLPESSGGPASSTAGEIILSNGNEVIAVAKMRGQMLVATDTDLYAMFSDVENGFAFKSVAEARVIGPNSLIQANGVVYFMGEEQFYVFDGTLHVIKCDVRQAVFENINLDQFYKVFGSLNTAFNEVWWFYPSYESNENDSYVVYNFLKNIWYFGTLERSAFIDIGEVVPNPMATSPDGYLYAHEDGLDDDGSPMVVYLESGDISIAQRNKFVYVKNLIPDLITINKPFQIYVTIRNYPQSPPRVYGPFNINPAIPAVINEEGVIVTPAIPATDIIGTRAKGGQISIKYIQNDPLAMPPQQFLGAEFQVGQIEVQFVPTGVK